MDKTKFLEERQFLGGDEGKQLFPNLGKTFEVLDRSTMKYNCIAYTLGWSDLWVDPEDGPPNEPLAKMDSTYQIQGYSRSEMLEFSLEPGKRKVVVYAIKKADGSIEEITHAAIQDGDGTWLSKLGRGPLIRHETPQALSGPAYGEPVAVYVREEHGSLP